ncbi:AAA family ATPase [Corallococcus carmarthensis]|uniref:ATP-binding protein n=1 Tax=Corallococcus carmarthensis TaxID=2316728 RepID=A0A3A8KVB3_9BACT|nr:ATP-binding protein [Corallococcus carmarthensis]NOK16383.1 AAA family ATPase [Corallococcus carmarthensis]RKH06332.1 ATP-binding protein [Corallococcus carmarthensis]
MLRALHLQGVGPAPRLDVEFAPRLNVLTGDNGLGKSFLLDVAWWSLTGTWPGFPAWPHRGVRRRRIEWTLTGKSRRASNKRSDFDAGRQLWPWPEGRPSMPGLTVYARVDGSFSVWDPARNYWHKTSRANLDGPHRPDAFHFSPQDLWDGLKYEGTTVCNGLVRDWLTWQLQDDGSEQSPFQMLKRALEQLSPRDEPLRPGKPMRLAIEDVQNYPTLDMPYGTIPVVHASAGMRRILGLAYLVVWAWHEHLQASEFLGQAPDPRFILLVDEVETHLHPLWQRRIVGSLIQVIDGLASETSVQTFLTTHSPLVLASLEPFFDEEQDALFLFQLEQQRVHLKHLPWAKQGDANDWLTSPVMGLAQARAWESERAVEAAEAYMRGEREGVGSLTEIDAELRRLLPEQDPFWPRWIVARDGGGVRDPVRSKKRT